LQNTSTGFVVGGGVTFGLALIVLLVLSLFMPYFLPSIVGMVAGAITGLYGLEYSQLGLLIDGGVVGFIGLVGFALTSYFRFEKNI